MFTIVHIFFNPVEFEFFFSFIENLEYEYKVYEKNTSFLAIENLINCLKNNGKLKTTRIAKSNK